MSKKQKWYTNLYNLLSEFMFLTTLYKTTLLKHIKMLKQNQIKQTKKKPTSSKFQASIFLFFLCNLSFCSVQSFYFIYKGWALVLPSKESRCSSRAQGMVQSKTRPFKFLSLRAAEKNPAHKGCVHHFSPWKEQISCPFCLYWEPLQGPLRERLCR